MKRSIMRSVVIPIEVEAESAEEAERMHVEFIEWLSQRPRMLMAKGKWKIKRSDAE